MKEIQDFFKSQRFPDGLVLVNKADVSLITESEVRRRDQAGEDNYEVVDGKILVMDNYTDIYKFPNDEIYITINTNGSLETNDYSYTDLNISTYTRRAPEGDNYEVEEVIYFQTPEMINENAKRIKDPVAFRKQRMEEIRKKKEEEQTMAKKDFKELQNNGVNPNNDELDKELEGMVDEAINEEGQGQNNGGTNLDKSDAFGGKSESEMTDEEKKAARLAKKAEDEKKKAEQIRIDDENNRKSSEFSSNVAASTSGTAVSARVTLGATKHMQFEGVLTKTEPQTRVVVRKKNKLDANGKFIFNNAHKAATSTDPEILREFQEEKAKSVSENKKIPQKFRVKEKYIDVTQSKPAGVERYFISMPDKIILSASAEEMERTFAELDEMQPNQIARHIKAVTLDQLNAIYAKFGLVGNNAAESKALRENTAIYTGQTSELVIFGKLDEKKSTPDTKVIRFVKKRFGRKSDVAEGAYFPARVYQQADLTGTISEDMSEKLNKTFFGNLFETDEDFANGVESQFTVFDKASKLAESKFFATDMANRMELKVHPFSIATKERDESNIEKVTRIPFKAVKMVKDKTGALVESVSKSGKVNTEYKKVPAYEVEGAQLKPGVVMNNPLLDTEFKTIIHHLGDLLSAESLKAYTVKASKRKSMGIENTGNLLDRKAASALAYSNVDSFVGGDNALYSVENLGDLSNLEDSVGTKLK